MTTVAVVGGGITGLAAAYELATSGAERVVLLEAGDRLGGKIRTSEVAGVAVDEGADAFLARVPWATELAQELGLGDDLVSPAEGSALVWSRGALRRIPDGVVLGVPTDFVALARSGLVSSAGVARAALDLVLPTRRPPGDEAAGALVRRRMGGEVATVLVDPLLGGINAGDADRLSLAASAPQLAEAAARHRSLALGLRQQRRAAPAGPVFHSLPGGMQRLTDTLAGALGPTEIRLGTAVEELAADPAGGWRLTPATGEPVRADAVVLTTPAPPTARLLATAAPDVAADLARVEYASVVLATMAFPPAAVARPLDASGYLVPRGEGLLTTACSWASSKWSHLGGGPVLLRVSAGRFGDTRPMELDDGELVDRLVAELGTVMGVTGRPTDLRISRWPFAFPQYTPGHLDRVDRIEGRLAETMPGVVVAGAAYRGVGIPACIRQGREAARRVLAGGRAGTLVPGGEA